MQDFSAQNLRTLQSQDLSTVFLVSISKKRLAHLQRGKPMHLFDGELLAAIGAIGLGSAALLTNFLDQTILSILLICVGAYALFRAAWQTNRVKRLWSEGVLLIGEIADVKTVFKPDSEDGETYIWITYRFAVPDGEPIQGVLKISKSGTVYVNQQTKLLMLRRTLQDFLML